MSEFDEQKVRESIELELTDGDPPWLDADQLKELATFAYIQGARYQHAQDAATIEKLEARIRKLREALEWVDEYIRRYVIVTHASCISGHSGPYLNAKGDDAETALRRKIAEALGQTLDDWNDSRIALKQDEASNG